MPPLRVSIRSIPVTSDDRDAAIVGAEVEVHARRQLHLERHRPPLIPAAVGTLGENAATFGLDLDFARDLFGSAAGQGMGLDLGPNRDVAPGGTEHFDPAVLPSIDDQSAARRRDGGFDDAAEALAVPVAPPVTI